MTNVSVTSSLKALAKIHSLQRSIAGCLQDAAAFKAEGDMEMYQDCLNDVEKYKSEIIELWPLVSEADQDKYQHNTVSYDDGNGEVKPYISIN